MWWIFLKTFVLHPKLGTLSYVSNIQHKNPSGKYKSFVLHPKLGTLSHVRNLHTFFLFVAHYWQLFSSVSFCMHYKSF